MIREDDSLGDLETKMRDMVEVLTTTDSLALAVRGCVDTSRLVDPEAVAIESMPMKERAFYEAFKRNGKIEEQTWAIAPPELKMTSASGKKYAQWAEIAKDVFNGLAPTPAQLKAYCQEDQSLIPLFLALARIDSVKKNTTSGVGGIDPKDFVELQALNKVISTTGAIVQQLTTEVKRVTRLQNDLRGLCQARINSLPKQEKANRARTPLDITAWKKVTPAIGTKPMNWSKLTEGTREDRDSLLEGLRIPTMSVSEPRGRPPKRQRVTGRESHSPEYHPRTP
jgi:hypothetical protein